MGFARAHHLRYRASMRRATSLPASTNWKLCGVLCAASLAACGCESEEAIRFHDEGRVCLVSMDRDAAMGGERVWG